MTEPRELLPCPFCGGAPTAIERPDNIDGTQFFYAIACYCGRYSACAHKMAIGKTPEIAKADAIAAWNTRTPQPTQAQAGAVPLNWPTNEMIEAGRKAAISHGPLLGGGQSLWHVFRDMLAAAPSPQKQGGQHD